MESGVATTNAKRLGEMPAGGNAYMWRWSRVTNAAIPDATFYPVAFRFAGFPILIDPGITLKRLSRSEGEMVHF